MSTSNPCSFIYPLWWRQRYIHCVLVSFLQNLWQNWTLEIDDLKYLYSFWRDTLSNFSLFIYFLFKMARGIFAYILKRGDKGGRWVNHFFIINKYFVLNSISMNYIERLCLCHFYLTFFAIKYLFHIKISIILPVCIQKLQNIMCHYSPFVYFVISFHFILYISWKEG